MEIKLEPKQIAVTLLWIVAVLTLINSVVVFFYFYLDDDSVFGLVDLFDFAIEGNIPTFYSATAILFSSALLALVTRANWHKPDGNRFYWLALTMLFLFLAFDEAAAIHEGIGDYFERFIHAEGYLYFMWVVPYGIATIGIGLVFLRFVLGLPRQTRTRFIAAGIIFLSGAVGLEMLGAREADLYSTDTVTYCVLYTFEELFEMLGIVLFIYALLCHLTNEIGSVRVVMHPPGGNGNSSVRGAQLPAESESVSITE